MDVGEFICFDPIFDQSTKVTLKSISGMSSFKYFVQFKICSHYLYTVEKYVLDMRFVYALSSLLMSRFGGH